jgi:regulator of nucleoside diphosphate kinase
MTAVSKQSTLYLTELDVTRLERIASRPGAEKLADMLDVLLERAAIVPAETIPQDVVTMNSSVLCTLEGEKEPRQWTLVYPDAADLEGGQLSVLSPVGTALLGARAGETVTYRLPDGREQHVTVVELSYQPEANGQFTL